MYLCTDFSQMKSKSDISLEPNPLFKYNNTTLQRRSSEYGTGIVKRATSLKSRMHHKAIAVYIVAAKDMPIYNATGQATWVVSNHWTGLLDWIAGLDCWTGLLDWIDGLDCLTGLLDWIDWTGLMDWIDWTGLLDWTAGQDWLDWIDGLDWLDWIAGLDCWTGLLDWIVDWIDWTGLLDWIDWTGLLDWIVWTGLLDWHLSWICFYHLISSKSEEWTSYMYVSAC